MIKDLRSGDGCTGQEFGLYFKIRTLVPALDKPGKKEAHEIHVYASTFEIAEGHLLLYDKNNIIYRAFAPGTWAEIASISCMNGNEMFEDRDWVYVDEEDGQ